MMLIQRWKQTALHNKALVMTSVLVAFGTLFYAGAAIFQLSILRESSDRTSRQNDKLIAEADRISKSIENSVAQNRSALESSISQSKAALDTTVKQFRLEQRAWIATTESIAAIEPDKPTSFTVSTTNVGKTFAKKVIIRNLVSFSSKELNEVELTSQNPNLGDNSKVASIAVLAPNFPYQSKDSVPARYTGLILQRLGSAGYTYVWGEVTYEDIFGKRHLTKYCGYRSVASADTVLLQCKFHNDAD